MCVKHLAEGLARLVLRKCYVVVSGAVPVTGSLPLL